MILHDSTAAGTAWTPIERSERFAATYRDRAAARAWFCRKCGEAVDSRDLESHLRGHDYHTALLLEARTVIAEVLATRASGPEEVAVALHRAAGDDLLDADLATLAEVLGA
jgi:hypothetical protein